MTERPRYDPKALVADVPRDSNVPRYTRKPPAPVEFVDPWQHHDPENDSLEIADDRHPWTTAPRT